MNHQRPDPSPDLADLDDVNASVHELTARLAEVVPSFVGMTLTMLQRTRELTWTVVGPSADRAPTTSLRFSVAGPGGHLRTILHAYQPGALVDLHADLTHVSQPRHGARAPAATDVCLDQDLVSRLVPRRPGLEELAALGRAEGVLIEQGADPEQAASQLRQAAAAAGLELHQYARRLVATCTAGPASRSTSPASRP